LIQIVFVEPQSLVRLAAGYGSRELIERDMVELANLLTSRCTRPFLVVQCPEARIIKIEILGRS
jgi:hypothetical protein